MIVYYGSTVVVQKPLCHIGRDNLDFGQGFYVTNNRVQAEQWAQRQALRTKQTAYINRYEFEREIVITQYRYKLFLQYDMEWLDFIVQSRLGNKPWLNYDCIEGGIADDRVIDTVNLYHIGMIPAEIALKELAKHQPNNQICIIKQAIINQHLHYLDEEIII